MKDWIFFIGAIALLFAWIALWRVGMSKWIAHRMRKADYLDEYDQLWLDCYDNKHSKNTADPHESVDNCRN